MRPTAANARMHTTVLCLAVVLVFVEARTTSAQGSRCPPWLAEYQQFHKANRTSPDAHFLIALGPPGLGIGDRFRGFLFALRLAAATRRVLLCTWTAPGEIEDYLEPAGDIDWRLAGTAAEAVLAADTLANIDNAPPSPDINHLHLQLDYKPRENNPLDVEHWAGVPAAKRLSSRKFLVVRTNKRIEDQCEICPTVESRYHPDAVCMAQAMFTTTQKVKDMATVQLGRLYPNMPSTLAASSDAGYVAVHLRLGHMKGEEKAIRRVPGHQELQVTLEAISCAWGLSNTINRQINMATTPILLLTDHKDVRHFAQHGRLANVVSPSYDAVHIAYRPGFTLLPSRQPTDALAEEYDAIFADVELLARSTCLVRSRSGFSEMGWLLGGGKSCGLNIMDCFKECGRRPGSPFCTHRKHML